MARYGRRYSHSYSGFAPYVPVAERRRKAASYIGALAKNGEKVSPVRIEGRTIATTFWGTAWCENLESYSDFENRLPRGRTYVRNGSVLDLRIGAGKVEALVIGSSIYEVEITIEPVPGPTWKAICGKCAGGIESVVELLQGRLSRGVMEIMTRRGGGLFPTPREIQMTCSCPDYATMCKHVAATLYGVGARLDREPELLFTLRKVDHLDLIGNAAADPALIKAHGTSKDRVLDGADLSGIFGIDLDAGTSPAAPKAAPPRKRPPKTRTAQQARSPVKLPGRRARVATVTARDLVRRGIPHATIQNWLRAGILMPSGKRGVYKKTPDTEPRIVRYLAEHPPR